MSYTQPCSLMRPAASRLGNAGVGSQVFELHDDIRIDRLIHFFWAA